MEYFILILMLVWAPLVPLCEQIYGPIGFFIGIFAMFLASILTIFIMSIPWMIIELIFPSEQINKIIPKCGRYGDFSNIIEKNGEYYDRQTGKKYQKQNWDEFIGKDK